MVGNGQVTKLVGGWFQPIGKKLYSQIGSFPQVLVGVKVPKIFELPPPGKGCKP